MDGLFYVLFSNSVFPILSPIILSRYFLIRILLTQVRLELIPNINFKPKNERETVNDVNLVQ